MAIDFESLTGQFSIRKLRRYVSKSCPHSELWRTYMMITPRRDLCEFKIFLWLVEVVHGHTLLYLDLNIRSARRHYQNPAAWICKSQ
jgi:hypothetical protein